MKTKIITGAAAAVLIIGSAMILSGIFHETEIIEVNSGTLGGDMPAAESTQDTACEIIETDESDTGFEYLDSTETDYTQSSSMAAYTLQPSVKPVLIETPDDSETDMPENTQTAATTPAPVYSEKPKQENEEDEIGRIAL